MKKVFKILFFALLAYALFTLGKTVSANSINRISMDIFVDSNGNANVTETWNCYSNQSTEIYHPYYNLGNSEITNLSVSMDSTQFETLSSWDTSTSFDEKAYKAGINRVSNGVELCWGISEYGTNIYRVNYTVTNFVSNLTDSQSRRLGIRIKGDKGNYFAHTLNNTVVAPPRMLIAFLENNYNEDGSINIPEVLRPYMGGTEKLIPKK